MSENFLLNTRECQPNSTESMILGHTFSNKKNKNNSSKQKFSIGYLRGNDRGFPNHAPYMVCSHTEFPFQKN